MLTINQKLAAFATLGLMNAVSLAIAAIAGGLVGLLVAVTYLGLSLTAGARIAKI